jgi:anti-anti-sigma factor
MTTCMEGPVAYLKGDLTHIGVTRNIINSLAVSLHKTESGAGKNIRIDCTKVRSADTSGLQLLYVWMQCARFRGVETVLVNMSDSLKRIMRKRGLRHCFRTTRASSESSV